MEIHAHHLHKVPSHGWKHYLFEFLMLFLAVFCGFIAENQREHFVEKNRSKEYAKSLFGDLQSDTNEIRRGINQSNFIMTSIDSLISFTSKNKFTAAVPGSFYYYSWSATATFRIDWSKSTIEQLVQSGALRYFEDKELVNMINYYYYMQGIITAANQMDMTHRDKVLDLRNQILQSRFYSIFSRLNPDVNSERHLPTKEIDSLMSRSLPLQENAAQKMDEFINHCSDRRSRLNAIANSYYPAAERIAEDIFKRLSEDYHLKNKRAAKKLSRIKN
jgi:hypothetical protein